MYEYEARITNVVDGDTFDFVIDLGFGITYSSRLRLYGVDTPEVRGEEKKEGLVVKDYVESLFEIQPEVTLRTKKWQGKYGRYVAEVILKDHYTHKNLGERLVFMGMAKKVDY